MKMKKGTQKVIGYLLFGIAAIIAGILEGYEGYRIYLYAAIGVSSVYLAYINYIKEKDR